MDALEACYTRVDPICNAILSFKASTREGRAVRKMARAIGWANGVDEAFGEFANRLCNIKFPKEWADHLTAV